MLISREDRAYPVATIERIVCEQMRLTPEDSEMYANAKRCLYMAFDTAEAFTNRVIVSSKVIYSFSALSSVIELPTAPISEIISIDYYDEGDEVKTLGADSYTLSASEDRSIIELFKIPELSPRRKVNRVQITCLAGYADPEEKEGDSRPPLPGFVIAAAQLLAGTYFESDGDVVIGRQVSALPISAQRLLSHYRIMPYGGEDQN